MILIDSNANAKIKFFKASQLLLENIIELQKLSDQDYDVKDFFEHSKIDNLILSMHALPLDSNALPELGLLAFNKLANNSVLEYLVKKYKQYLSYTYEMFENNINSFYHSFLDRIVCYKIDALEYYKIIIEKKIETLHYRNNNALIFLNDGKVIIFPFKELIEIHLYTGRQELGNIQTSKYGPDCVYFSRNYLRWMGVGKDDIVVTEHYKFNINTLQIEKLKH